MIYSFKKFNEQKSENYAYHITNRKNLNSIKEKGLLVNTPSYKDNVSDIKGIHLFETIEDAEESIGGWFGKRAEEWEERTGEVFFEVILRVDLTGLENKLKRIVENEIICLVDIDPSRIDAVFNPY